ncbi:MAG: hypothetical protein HC936_08205 [Leptolyngbyaceae cyanobacterium SU_3_3]|nr:hypothetical protein [Leptolyngbyaceae cyanobacterium SU_3_3]
MGRGSLLRVSLALLLRDRVITITSAQNKLRYSVETRDGQVLADDLTEAQLEARHPELYQQIRPAIAQPQAVEPLWMIAPVPLETK